MSTPTRRRVDEDADVIVVGAGPAGSTAATYLARAGLDVLLLEKGVFPREKVCGDGLTPRGVKQLIDLLRQIGEVEYLNCGDWVESCSALIEHWDGSIQLYRLAEEQAQVTELAAVETAA